MVVEKNLSPIPKEIFYAQEGAFACSPLPPHIVQRGHNCQAVFLADDGYQFYLENLKEWKQKLGIKLYAWCLMDAFMRWVMICNSELNDINSILKSVHLIRNWNRFEWPCNGIN